MALASETAGFQEVKFPMEIDTKLCGEVVNPEDKVVIDGNSLKLKSAPSTPIFYSDLSGSSLVPASWSMANEDTKLIIRETGNFRTDRINIWGVGHVISPELFFPISLSKGEHITWSRKYHLGTF